MEPKTQVAERIKVIVTEDVKEFILSSFNIRRNVYADGDIIFSYPDLKGEFELVDEPYLSGKDIKSEGFVNDITLGYQEPDLMICETTERTNESYYKATYSFKRKRLELEDCEGLIFTGTIRNKSSFQRILQMTGVS